MKKLVLYLIIALAIFIYIATKLFTSYEDFSAADCFIGIIIYLTINNLINAIIKKGEQQKNNGL